MYRKKTLEKIVVVVLCFMQIASFLAIPASAAYPAETQIVAPSLSRFARIKSFEVDLTINSSGLTTSYSKVKLAESTDTASLTIELQWLNGSTWSTEKSWSTSGSGTISIEKDWYVLHGTYRVLATARVYNSTGLLLETATLSSISVKY